MTALAFVLLDSPALPPADGLIARLRQRSERAYRLQSPETKAGGAMPTVTFRMEDDEALVALMDLPVPWSDLEGPVANALWSKAKEVCLKHKAHLVVALRGETEDLVGQHLRLTDLVAAAVAETNATAVYWGAARLVHPGGVFRELATLAERNALPLHLWIDVQVWRTEGGGRMIVTNGLKEFGLPEIEGASGSLQPKVLRDKVFNTAHYLLDQGTVPKDGETIGFDPQERIPVRRRESEREGVGQVLWLDFDGAARPGLLSRMVGGLLGRKRQ
jgi:hypothetical protein